ncbi:MAG: magnesium transporter, partial [Sciscionella sp.]
MRTVHPDARVFGFGGGTAVKPDLIVLCCALGWTVAYRLTVVLRRGPLGPTGRRARGVLVVIVLMFAQIMLLTPTASAASCGAAPLPERPGSGMVGAIDPPAVDRGDPTKSPYGVYSYAGTDWNTYQQANSAVCIPDATATIDTWAGNQLFDVGKNIVGATNSLHYSMLSQDSMLAPLDKAVKNAAKTFYNNIYVRWFAIAALILAIMMFRYIWSGDLASIGTRGMWALAGMWLAASVFALGPIYTTVDSMLLDSTSQIQAGFLSPDAAQQQQNVLPDTLYNNVIYRNWLRGEFGDADSPQAKKYGSELLADQAWKKTESNSTDDQAKIQAKQADYKSMPGKLGSAAEYFTGSAGSRTGTGFLAMLQGFAYALFQLLAKAAVLLAQILIRVLILGSPVIGLAAMVLPDLLRKVARAAGAIALSVLLFSAMAGAHALLLNLIFGAGSQLSLIAQMMLAGLVTIVFLMLSRPIRRMRQMVELSVGAAGSGFPTATGGMLSRLRRRGSDPAARTSQEQFWSNVRTADGGRTPVDPRLRAQAIRPEESGGPVAATAQRLDEYYPGAGGPPGGGTPRVPTAVGAGDGRQAQRQP